MITTAIKKLKTVNVIILILLVSALLFEVGFGVLSSSEFHVGPDFVNKAEFALSLIHLGIIVALIIVVVLVFRPSILDLVRGHDAIVEREAQTQSILDTASEGYALIAPDTLQYIEVNDAMCDMLGVSRDEILGKTPLDFCDAASAKVIRAQTSTINDTDQRSYEVVFRHKDGHAVYTQHNASTLRDKDGQAVAAFAFISNVTRLREAQKAMLKAKEQAEDATRLKDKVVSLIAHDLKNPLGAIRGFADLMLTDTQEPLSSGQKESVGYIHGQANELLDLIAQILDISRLQTGKIVPDKTFFDAHFTVEDVFNRLGPQATEKGVLFENALDVGTRVYADMILLNQVIQNLISNAIKFSHAGMTVRVSAHRDDGRVQIRVADTGVGIPVSAQAKLFLMEEHTSTHGTSGETGTGFGLPLSHQIMAAHDGDLSVTSSEGEGATFVAELPERAPEVLLVDDDEYFSTLAATYLAGVGAVVTKVENGQVALDALNDGLVPDLIICDLMMPEMDGMTFLSKVMNDSAKCDIPIIVVSGAHQSTLSEQALKLGAADFTAKPINPEEFLPRVRRYLG